jgi:chemotaxis family two-component system response regulator Rcp1
MSYVPTERPIEILLVEDHVGDAQLMQEAFEQSPVCNHLHTVKDGAQAMAFLYRHAPYNDAVRPDIILLDLTLPKKDGREVLAEIKADSKLRYIPIVVLAAVQREEDVLDCYDLRANSFIAKPESPDQFVEVVRAIEKYWLMIAQLPPRESYE